MVEAESGNHGNGKEDHSWPCIRELASTKGKHGTDHSISDRLLAREINSQSGVEVMLVIGFVMLDP